MQRLAVGLLVVCLGAAGAQERPALLDFEQGLAGWWTNPWGGGRITAEPTADAKAGHGALHAVYQTVEGKLNGNVISPAFAADAQIPETWDCPRCGLPANLDSENPPPPPKITPYKTHLAYVKERRSDAEAAAILSEALDQLRARRAAGEVIY